VRWSVALEAEVESGRVLSREEIVELADAVAMRSGVASGIGTNRYGARLVVVAESREDAIAKATDEFVQAAARAGLPKCPIALFEVVSEDEDRVGYG
jgi:hypothetical protein